jgi:DNA-binding IclR family transcriptional regulator
MSRVPRGGANDIPTRTGTQAIQRAMAVLRAIAARGDAGARLTDLVNDLGLSKPTIRRLVASLVEENVAAQDLRSRRYYLGLDLFSLGALAGRRLDLRRAAAPSLSRLADETQDTVFLSIPDGIESVCVARYEGAFPIKTLTMSVGDRRPLGIGAGSLAILSQMPEQDAQGILAANAHRYEPYAPEITVERLVERMREARRAGYASSAFFFGNGMMMPGMNAVGIPIVTPYGVVLGAVSIAAVPDRLRSPRREEVVALAKLEAQRIAERTARHSAE